MLNTDLSAQIQSYIQTCPQSQLKQVQPTELQGKRYDLEVYRLPIDILRFNIRNGRFAAEYRELKSKLKRELDPSDKEDQKQIRRLLLEQDNNATRLLKEDLIRVGQKNPGIITYDGYVINGNRRMAIFDSLLEETGEEKWGYMEVSILPKGTGEQDVWRIEAGLQFSREERLDYGPINKLLKFREGIEAGLTTTQIAATLFGGFTTEEIKEELERLKLIESYLDFVGKLGHYKTAEGLNEHFIDLRKFIAKEEKKGTDKLLLMKVIKFAFDLIRNGISHLDLRDLNKVMTQEPSKKNLLVEITSNTGITQVVNAPKIAACEIIKPQQLPKKLGEEAASMQVFRESVEIAEAAEEKDKPILLLKKAIANLKSIDPPSLRKNAVNVNPLLDELGKILEKIKKELSSQRELA